MSSAVTMPVHDSLLKLLLLLGNLEIPQLATTLSGLRQVEICFVAQQLEPTRHAYMGLQGTASHTITVLVQPLLLSQTFSKHVQSRSQQWNPHTETRHDTLALESMPHTTTAHITRNCESPHTNKTRRNPQVL